VNKLNMTRDRVGLTSFSTDATLDCFLTNNTGTINNKINQLTANGYTNIGGGISKANEEFVNHGRPDAIWVIILLSDGVANRPSPEDYARQYAIDQADCAKILNDKGVRIYTIGLGAPQDLDEALLKEIAFDESKYYHAPTAAELESIYIAISKDILLQVKYDIVIIQLNLWGSG
jgi:Mg-chelatase subunit ChlD